MAFTRGAPTIFSPTTPVVVTPGGAGAVGSAQTSARSDHNHPATDVGNMLGPESGVQGDIIAFSTIVAQHVLTLTPVTNWARIEDTGEFTALIQPSVSATISAEDTDATGDGTAVQVSFANEIVDQGADFGGVTFTAPIAGNYYMQFQITLTGLLSTHTKALMQVSTSNRGYFRDCGDPFVVIDADGDFAVYFGLVVEMDASDTANFQITVSNGTKVVDLKSGQSWLSIVKLN